MQKRHFAVKKWLHHHLLQLCISTIEQSVLKVAIALQLKASSTADVCNAYPRSEATRMQRALKSCYPMQHISMHRLPAQQPCHDPQLAPKLLPTSELLRAPRACSAPVSALAFTTADWHSALHKQ